MDLVVELGPGRIHVAVGIADRLRFVMRAQRFVVAQTDGDRFMSAIHRHEVDVDVDQQIAFGRAAI